MIEVDDVHKSYRSGAREVVCAYRRTEAEMGGREEERRHAEGRKQRAQADEQPLDGRARLVRIAPAAGQGQPLGLFARRHISLK